MTVSVESNKDIYTGNGSTTQFQYNFKIVQDSDLLVMIETSNNVFETKTLDVDYTVTGAGNESGGTVTFTVAPEDTLPVILYGQYDLLQESNFEEGDSLPAETLEDTFDKTAMVLNRLNEHINRSISFKVTSEVEDITIPDPESNKVLAWNSAADNLENITNPAVAAAASASSASDSAAAASASASSASDSAAAAAASAAEAAGAGGGGGGGTVNYLINGTFDFWQRGTSQTESGNIGAADHWAVMMGGGGSWTFQRASFADGQTTVSGGPTYYLNVSIDMGDPGTSEYFYFTQPIEDVRILSGETVTLSFWAKTGGEGEAHDISVEFVQNMGEGGSSEVTAAAVEKINLSGADTWTRYTQTFTLPDLYDAEPTIGNYSYTAVNFWLTAGTNYNARTDTLTTTDPTIYFAMIQLEKGSSASAFQYRPYAEELLLCQRYCFTCDPKTVTAYRYTTDGGGRDLGHVDYPVTMLKTPDVTLSNQSYNNCSSVYTAADDTNCAFLCSVSAEGSVYKMNNLTALFEAELIEPEGA